jgi:hypothetical protein
LLAFLGGGERSEPALAAEPCPHVNGIESLRVVRKVMDGVAAALAFRALGYVCGGGTKPKPKRRRWAALRRLLALPTQLHSEVRLR